jgi:hypothetical protein
VHTFSSGARAAVGDKDIELVVLVCRLGHDHLHAQKTESPDIRYNPVN